MHRRRRRLAARVGQRGNDGARGHRTGTPCTRGGRDSGGARERGRSRQAPSSIAEVKRRRPAGALPVTAVKDRGTSAGRSVSTRKKSSPLGSVGSATPPRSAARYAAAPVDFSAGERAADSIHEPPSTRRPGDRRLDGTGQHRGLAAVVGFRAAGLRVLCDRSRTNPPQATFDDRIRDGCIGNRRRHHRGVHRSFPDRVRRHAQLTHPVEVGGTGAVT